MKKLQTLAMIFFVGSPLSAATISRTLSSNSYALSTGINVTITVTADAGTWAYGVEETPPTGWTITNVNASDGGSILNGVIKWGPIVGNAVLDSDAATSPVPITQQHPSPLTRTLTYTVTPNSGSNGTKTFGGRASFDGNSPTTTAGTTSVTDGIAPVISAVSATGVTGNSATIKWTTDEASDSQVEYGLDTNYGSQTTLVATKVTSHSIGLTALQMNTLYHYRVKSKDAAGNLATSADFTFTTTNVIDSTPPTLSSIAATPTSNSAVITWTTNEAASTQIDFGLTSSYGMSTALDLTLVTSHSGTLSGLSPSTVYHYRVRSQDAAGNENISTTDRTFTTLASGSSPTSQATMSGTEFLPFKNVLNPNQGTMTINYAIEGETMGTASVRSAAVFGGNGSGSIITVYDRLGNKVRSLSEGTKSGSGFQTSWDGRNEQGTVVAAGTYIVVLNHDGKVVKRKVIVIK